MDLQYKLIIVNTRTDKVLATFEYIDDVEIKNLPNVVVFKTNGYRHIISLNSDTMCFVVDKNNPFMNLYFN